MKLRKLIKEDACAMLEWMHDENVTRWMQTDFSSKTLHDCESFIEKSQDTGEDLNLAIVDEDNHYLGTVSLKHIDMNQKIAEFAITISSKAMGNGVSKYGMEEILRIGIEELGLENIFWCVSKENERAIRFYEKGKGKRTNCVPNEILDRYHDLLDNLIWYVV